VVRISLFPRLGHADGHAAALLDALDLAVADVRLQVRAVELHSEAGEALRPAEGTGLEGLLLFPNVPRDVEGVALAVAEAVDDGAAPASLLTDRLPQRLRLAPVALQVLALRHHQSFLAGGQHFLFACAPVGGVGVGLEGGRDGSLRSGFTAGGGETQQAGEQQPQRHLTAHPGIDRERENIRSSLHTPVSTRPPISNTFDSFIA